MKTIINACTKSTTMNINSNSKIKSNNSKSSQLEQSSKNMNQEAPYIAERILQTMVDWYKKGLLEEGPSNHNYIYRCNQISCWSKIQSIPKWTPEYARKIYITVHMIHQYQQTGNNTSVQTQYTITYSSVLDAYANETCKSTKIQKRTNTARALQILEKSMMEQYNKNEKEKDDQYTNKQTSGNNNIPSVRPNSL
ncbi:hypothetical protein FRACYDRAFT_250765 [Fragilariopsis cylindrus CCMP1102]|uniref:Uncharacterized protein n=1 Tax=Fragilariopsis cylindrus CCMP1102 TaxID=635003 RepID=A0A1E7EP74_9STRA|nr:hypothetical protein FRACYDRAFT_250765 [Fragilariopsis cylindrus CCMP1102]|eukprot:OEU07741.1 hypothetical protein FRACYDRAFT_250765 [Fragilariopsis cylindrus CCMP1102]